MREPYAAPPGPSGRSGASEHRDEHTLTCCYSAFVESDHLSCERYNVATNVGHLFGTVPDVRVRTTSMKRSRIELQRQLLLGYVTPSRGKLPGGDRVDVRRGTITEVYTCQTVARSQPSDGDGEETTAISSGRSKTPTVTRSERLCLRGESIGGARASPSTRRREVPSIGPVPCAWRVQVRTSRRFQSARCIILTVAALPKCCSGTSADSDPNRCGARGRCGSTTAPIQEFASCASAGWPSRGG